MTLVLAVAVLAACNKKPTSTKSTDPVDQKLQELAGDDAKDCGHIKAAAQSEAKPASDCAMQAAQAKKPFYVAYDMPGLTVAVAGSSDGKLYAVQSQTPATPSEGGSQSSAPPQITVNPCPSELRLASSGRVTCYAAGSFGAMGGANPHGGGMTMPPGGMMNPHGGDMAMPPAGTPNPHGTSGSIPSSHGSAKTDNSPAQPASKK